MSESNVMPKRNPARNYVARCAGRGINDILAKLNLHLVFNDDYVKMREKLKNYHNAIISRQDFEYLKQKKCAGDLNHQEKIDYISYQFFHHNGYMLNIFKPQSFNEKLQWLKLFYRDPLLTVCSDKYKMRNYVAQIIGEGYTVPLLEVYDHPDHIDYGRLPEQFVLKMNWGSGQNIIVKNKREMDREAMRSAMLRWIQPESNHYYYSFEWCYKNIEPKVICENYLENHGKEINDYKLFCFMGEVKFVLCVMDRFSHDKRGFYDNNFCKAPFTRRGYKNIDIDLPKPSSWEVMIALAKRLSAPFPFVRVDFLELEGKIFVGELTFYPASGLRPFLPLEADYTLGTCLTLPEVDIFRTVSGD